MKDYRRDSRRNKKQEKKQPLEKHYDKDRLTIQEREVRLRETFGPRHFMVNL